MFTDGTMAEDMVLIRFKVVDKNDNSPVFGKIQSGRVPELSPPGTSVMKVVATDDDEPGNINSIIAYSLISQNPPDDMFYMNRDGTIYVKKPLLDRENQSQYILTVRGQDLNGQPGGNSGTGTVTINVLGVNDMFPTLEKEEVVAMAGASTGGSLVGRKTKWIPPAKKIYENEEPPASHVAYIHSDKDSGSGNVQYSLKGVGADRYPFHVFTINSETGHIFLTKKLDREFIDSYNLTGVATFTDGTEAEENVIIRFKVVDENDNSPVFGKIQSGRVPELSPPGTSVMKVVATDDDEPGNNNSIIAYSLISQNPPDDMFYMDRNGTIYVKKPLLDRENQSQYILTVRGQDLNGQPGGNSGTGTVTINVLGVNDTLPTLEKEELQVVAVAEASTGDSLVGRKTKWIPPAKKVNENEEPPTYHVAYIQSDEDNGDGNVQFFLRGAGADRYPFHVFIINSGTGSIHLTRKLDREFIDSYNLTAGAMFTDGTEAEDMVHIRFKVVDKNDNSPVFGKIQSGRVPELSPPGTSVMKVVATDDDEPGNINSIIAYSLISQNPPDDMFYMDRDGTIYVKKPLLDRENQSQYILTVRGQDLNGQPGGNSGTGTVTINVLGVNDTFPTLEKEEYDGSTEENENGVEEMSIKAEEQRKVTNHLNVYESYISQRYWCFSPGTSKRFKLKKPSFNPSIKTIPLSEEPNTINVNDTIGRYTAVNGYAGLPAGNVMYAIGSDPDDWITIDPVSGDIKLKKIPDRESPAVINGTYYATILCITHEFPGKIPTGTVAIQVEDFNDNCPVLTSNMQNMCATDKSIIVSAYDEDAHPHGPPFHFSIVQEGTEGKWQVQHLNDTAIRLLTEEPIFPGFYTVEFLVKDMQGKACPEPQKVMVQVYNCETEGVFKKS
ncbi:cadherin-2-like [Mugil cephalus]|uniref:cadherin-2-like n=1 Tax=Mugil cephalus TaxID=48193 RepID=UPI001FB5E42E|nr:cadherin-2-like [Mugil cephalus]